VSRDRSGLQLDFSTIRCLRCRGQRILGQPCPECGMRQRKNEVNHTVQRRRAIAQSVRPVLEAELPLPTTPENIEDLRARAGEVFQRFMAALAPLSRQGSDATPVLQAAQRLNLLRHNAQVVQPRPWVQQGRSIRDAFKAYHRAAEFYLDAFSAQTLLESQQLARAGQEQLDLAASAAQSFSDEKNRQQQILTSSVDDIFDVLARTTFAIDSTHSSVPLLDTDVQGARIASEILAPGEIPLPGAGIVALWAVIFVEALMDRETYVTRAREVFRLLSLSPKCLQLFTDDAWEGNQTRAMQLLMDNARTLEAVLAAARHDSQSVRAMLLFVQDLFEGPFRHYIATLLSTRGSKSYARSVQQDAGKLLSQARQKFGAELAFGRSELLRNASAHLDYRVEGESIILSPGPYEVRMSATVFGDACLELVEELLSMQTAVQLKVIQSANVSTPGIDTEIAVRTMMTLSGYTTVQYVENQGVAAISGRGQLIAPLQLSAALGPLIPRTIQHLELKISVDGREITFAVPLSPIREFSQIHEVEGFEKQLAFMEIGRAATVDGEMYLKRDAFLHAIALLAGQQSTESLPNANRKIRQLRQCCLNVGEVEMASDLKLLVRALRLISETIAVDAVTQRALNRLAKLEHEPVDSPFLE
jgi:hypothetical protein